MRSSQGSSAVRVLVALVVTAAVGYAAAVFIPVVVASFQFAQAMDNEALHGALNEPAVTVHRRLLGKAHELGLPVLPDRIVVTKSGPHFDIRADYVVPIEMIGGLTLNWRFEPHKKGTRRPPAFDHD